MNANAQIRVVHLVETLEIGGLQTNLAYLLKAFKKEGFLSEVWCIFKRGPVAERIEREGIPVYDIGGRQNHTLFNIWRTYRKLRETKPSILHCHEFPAGVIGRLAAILAGVPILFSHFYSPRERWEVRRIHRWTESLLLPRTERVFACSIALKKNMSSVFGIPLGKIEVLYNGIDLEAFLPPGAPPLTKTELNLPEDSFVITDISRLVPHKGHRVLLDAVSHLKSKGRNLTVLLAGDGSERSALEGEVKKLGLDGTVRFLGTPEYVGGILALTDLFVLPSFKESFGIVLVEAALLGKPSVATRTGGVEEAVLHGKTGLLVEPGDAHALAEAIQTFLDHPERLQEFGKRAKSFCEETFVSGRWAAFLERAYRDALDRRPSLLLKGRERGR